MTEEKKRMLTRFASHKIAIAIHYIETDYLYRNGYQSIKYAKTSALWQVLNNSDVIDIVNYSDRRIVKKIIRHSIKNLTEEELREYYF